MLRMQPHPLLLLVATTDPLSLYNIVPDFPVAKNVPYDISKKLLLKMVDLSVDLILSRLSSQQSHHLDCHQDCSSLYQHLISISYSEIGQPTLKSDCCFSIFSCICSQRLTEHRQIV